MATASECQVVLWPSARRELRWMSGLLPLLYHDMRAAWSNIVHCSDSSSTGFGVCSARLDPALVAVIGRCDERWRYRAEDAVQSRSHALRPDILLTGVKTLSRLRCFREADEKRP